MSDDRDRWLRAYEGQPKRRGNFASSSFPLEPLYTPADLPDGFDPAADLGYPGAFPFTRGIQPTGYRGRLWTMRQYAGFGSAEETNARFRWLLEQGQSGLSVAFDLPTQMGYDSTDPMAEGEVGRAGVAIDSLEDMERLLDGIPLERVTTSMTINATAAILLLMVEAVAESRGVPPADLGGTTQNDILKEYVARGTFIFPPGPSLRLATDLIEYCTRRLPRWNPISVSGYHIREAGATAVQELAFTFANGRAYVRAAVERGLAVDAFAPRISFFFNAHNQLFEEIAKFRAARRIWARTMRDEFGATDPRSWMLRFHTQTAGSTLTARQTDVNVVRTAVQAIAAVLGGTQSLHTNARDEALSLPSEEAALLALRTQQVLAEESGIADVIDPLGGSWYVEALTARLEREARALIARIDDMGGVLKAIESGFIQDQIHQSAYARQMAVERGEAGVVGVNRHVMPERREPAPFRVDPDVARRQAGRLDELLRRRESARAATTLEALAQAARGAGSLIEPLRACVRAHVTVGEMCGRLREVFGDYREPGAR